MLIFGANRVDISGNKFYNPDTTVQYKGILVKNERDLNISGNQFYWDATYSSNWSASRVIDINNTLSEIPTVNISNNSFINNSSTAIACGVCADIAMHGAVVSDNIFAGSGIFTLPYSTNYTNNNVRSVQRDQSNVQKYGAASPTADTWRQGDIIWNRTPTSGNPGGWVCVLGGTPGTWLPIGNVGNLATTLATSQTPVASTTPSNYMVPIIMNGVTYYMRSSSTP